MKLLFSKSLFSYSPDQPNIDVPEETVSDKELELTCYAPDNCPSMAPQIQWMYTEYLPDPEFRSEYLANDNSAVLLSTLSFTPRPMHNGQLLGCRVYYPNTTLAYERLISLDIKCKLIKTYNKLSWSQSCFFKLIQSVYSLLSNCYIFLSPATCVKALYTPLNELPAHCRSRCKYWWVQ